MSTKINGTMKKLTFAIAFFGMLAATACKKETVVTTEVKPDSTMVVTTTTETSMGDSWDARMAKAETDLNNAKDRLAEATKNGDEKAKATAQDVADKAQSAWDKLKTEVKEGADKTKDALQDAKENAKENYNEALEKAKAK
jgi:ElaB/YqjD/DUF883 family membrane-anchored ribosome-binding protein